MRVKAVSPDVYTSLKVDPIGSITFLQCYIIKIMTAAEKNGGVDERKTHTQIEKKPLAETT